MALDYSYIDIPVKTQAGIPNPDNMSYEAQFYQQLQFKASIQGKPRTEIGQYKFTSPTSGITYDTNDIAYQGMVNIYNRGEEGMMNLLFHLYGDPTNGKAFIISARPFNDIIAYINGIMDGTYTVYNSYHLEGHPASYFVSKNEFNQTINQIKDGTIIVGNADKLDGFHASYFAKQTDMTSIQNTVNKILDGTTKVPNASYADKAGNADALGGQPASSYQLASKAVETFYGISTPLSAMGKNGDIYVLI